MRCNKLDINLNKKFHFYDASGKPTLFKYTYSKGWYAVKGDAVFKEHPYHFSEFIGRVLAHNREATFARCILEAKADLFGWKVKLGRFLTGRVRADDPRNLFRLRGC